MKHILRIPVIVILTISSIIYLTSCDEEPFLPTVSTSNVTAITQTTASSGGNVTYDGGASITAKGVCWSTSQSPTTSDNKTEDGTGTDTFTSNLTGLKLSTTYYVRAYATNIVGTAYGNEVSFTTEAVNLATLTTDAVSSITQTTASSGGNVTDDGGGAITEKGTCWATTSNPTITNDKTEDGTGSGSFTSNLSGLLSGTTYYVRAYATNIAGTAYGNEVSFTTSQLPAAGEWIFNASFGTYAFTIDSSGTKIPEAYYVFSNWSCGPVTESGKCYLKRDPPWPIEDGSFVIINTWRSSFSSYVNEFTVMGTYDPPNQKFSGTWTHDSFGTICSGTWEATAPN